MHRIGKFIEVTLHGLAVEVVHHGPAGARSPQDNTRIAVQLHEKVEDMFALRDIDRDGIVAGLVVVRNALGEMGDMLGHQADEQKLLGRVAAGIGHWALAMSSTSSRPMVNRPPLTSTVTG